MVETGSLSLYEREIMPLPTPQKVTITAKGIQIPQQPQFVGPVYQPSPTSQQFKQVLTPIGAQQAVPYIVVGKPQVTTSFLGPVYQTPLTERAREVVADSLSRTFSTVSDFYSRYQQKKMLLDLGVPYDIKKEPTIKETPEITYAGRQIMPGGTPKSSKKVEITVVKPEAKRLTIDDIIEGTFPLPTSYYPRVSFAGRELFPHWIGMSEKQLRSVIPFSLGLKEVPKIREQEDSGHVVIHPSGKVTTHPSASVPISHEVEIQRQTLRKIESSIEYVPVQMKRDIEDINRQIYEIRKAPQEILTIGGEEVSKQDAIDYLESLKEDIRTEYDNYLSQLKGSKVQIEEYISSLERMGETPIMPMPYKGYGLPASPTYSHLIYTPTGEIKGFTVPVDAYKQYQEQLKEWKEHGYRDWLLEQKWKEIVQHRAEHPVEGMLRNIGITFISSSGAGGARTLIDLFTGVSKKEMQRRRAEEYLEVEGMRSQPFWKQSLYVLTSPVAMLGYTTAGGIGSALAAKAAISTPKVASKIGHPVLRKVLKWGTVGGLSTYYVTDPYIHFNIAEMKFEKKGDWRQSLARALFLVQLAAVGRLAYKAALGKGSTPLAISEKEYMVERSHLQGAKRLTPEEVSKMKEAGTLPTKYEIGWWPKRDVKRYFYVQEGDEVVKTLPITKFGKQIGVMKVRGTEAIAYGIKGVPDGSKIFIPHKILSTDLRMFTEPVELARVTRYPAVESTITSGRQYHTQWRVVNYELSQRLKWLSKGMFHEMEFIPGKEYYTGTAYFSKVPLRYPSSPFSKVSFKPQLSLSDYVPTRFLVPKTDVGTAITKGYHLPQDYIIKKATEIAEHIGFKSTEVFNTALDDLLRTMTRRTWLASGGGRTPVVKFSIIKRLPEFQSSWLDFYYSQSQWFKSVKPVQPFVRSFDVPSLPPSYFSKGSVLVTEVTKTPPLWSGSPLTVDWNVLVSYPRSVTQTSPVMLWRPPQPVAGIKPVSTITHSFMQTVYGLDTLPQMGYTYDTIKGIVGSMYPWSTVTKVRLGPLTTAYEYTALTSTGRYTSKWWLDIVSRFGDRFPFLARFTPKAEQFSLQRIYYKVYESPIDLTQSLSATTPPLKTTIEPSLASPSTFSSTLRDIGKVHISSTQLLTSQLLKKVQNVQSLLAVGTPQVPKFPVLSPLQMPALSPYLVTPLSVGFLSTLVPTYDKSYIPITEQFRVPFTSFSPIHVPSLARQHLTSVYIPSHAMISKNIMEIPDIIRTQQHDLSSYLQKRYGVITPAYKESLLPSTIEQIYGVPISNIVLPEVTTRYMRRSIISGVSYRSILVTGYKPRIVRGLVQIPTVEVPYFKSSIYLARTIPVYKLVDKFSYDSIVKNISKLYEDTHLLQDYFRSLLSVSITRSALIEGLRVRHPLQPEIFERGMILEPLQVPLFRQATEPIVKPATSQMIAPVMPTIPELELAPPEVPAPPHRPPSFGDWSIKWGWDLFEKKKKKLREPIFYEYVPARERKFDIGDIFDLQTFQPGYHSNLMKKAVKVATGGIPSPKKILRHRIDINKAFPKKGTYNNIFNKAFDNATRGLRHA